MTLILYPSIYACNQIVIFWIWVFRIGWWGGGGDALYLFTEGKQGPALFTEINHFSSPYFTSQLFSTKTEKIFTLSTFLISWLSLYLSPLFSFLYLHSSVSHSVSLRSCCPIHAQSPSEVPRATCNAALIWIYCARHVAVLVAPSILCPAIRLTIRRMRRRVSHMKELRPRMTRLRIFFGYTNKNWCY